MTCRHSHIEYAVTDDCWFLKDDQDHSVLKFKYCPQCGVKLEKPIGKQKEAEWKKYWRHLEKWHKTLTKDQCPCPDTCTLPQHAQQ
jgi:hypothetical protein